MKGILLLHGALGSEVQLQPLKKLLKAHYNVYTLNFAGHGGTAIPAIFSIELFAKQVIDFCEANSLQSISIFGYSMGGYVGLYLAKNYPALVQSVVTLGTKLYWDKAGAAKEISMMQPEIIEAKIPEFAKQLQERHAPQDWKEIMNKTAEMLMQMGVLNPLTFQDFNSIPIPVMLALGDRDKMVTLQETVAAYKEFPKGQMAILPGTPHAIEQADLELLSHIIKNFISV